jgi:hypothetical protein
VKGNDVEDDHHESAGRAADLKPAATERGDREAGDHDRDETLVRGRARGDGQRHRSGSATIATVNPAKTSLKRSRP